MSKPAHNYLRDLGQLLKERAREAKTEKDAAAGTERFDYALGRLTGFHDVVSLMQQQAAAFQIPLADIGLDGISPERDLV